MAGEKWFIIVLVTVSETEVESLIVQFHELLGESAAKDREVPGLDRNRFRTLLYHEFGLTHHKIMDGGILCDTIYICIFACARLLANPWVSLK